jgi:hypothetical protein
MWWTLVHIPAYFGLPILPSSKAACCKNYTQNLYYGFSEFLWKIHWDYRRNLTLLKNWFWLLFCVQQKKKSSNNSLFCRTHKTWLSNNIWIKVQKLIFSGIQSVYTKVESYSTRNNTRACRNHTHACGNHTLRAEITLVRAEP